MIFTCPETKSGRLPPDEISACEFCSDPTPYCLDYRVVTPPEAEPLPEITCRCGQKYSRDLHDVCPNCERPFLEVVP